MWSSGDGTLQLLRGDCRAVLPSLPAESFTACVTDPPYELGFMGKKWDASGVAFQVETWAEVLRVLKPGAFLLAFGGTRTYHRMTCAIEDAGFEIRDCIMWVYGSGFPKSLDISKAIDKAGGKPTPPGFAEWLRAERERNGMTAKELCERGGFYKNINHGGLVSNWEAGIGFPDAEQFNLLCDLLELPFERREEARREILGWREVIPGVAFSSDGPSKLPITAPATDAAKLWHGYGTALKPALEPIVVAMKPLSGTFAQNALEHGVAGLNVDGGRIGTSKDIPASPRKAAHGGNAGGIYGEYQSPPTTTAGWDANIGRWPANLIHDGSEEVLAGFPREAGGGFGVRGGHRQSEYGLGGTMETVGFGDSGSAARFFYCAKASRSERGAGNKHPTVKPLALMEYLVKLVTMPQGTRLLDPFAGSGTTLLACYNAFVEAVGIDMEADHIDISGGRIKRVDDAAPLFDPKPQIQKTLLEESA